MKIYENCQTSTHFILRRYVQADKIYVRFPRRFHLLDSFRHEKFLLNLAHDFAVESGWFVGRKWMRERGIEILEAAEVLEEW